MSFSKAYKFRMKARELGFSCDDNDLQLAETGTAYLKVWYIDDDSDDNSKCWNIRFSNHGQVYDGADYSIDPQTGLTNAKVLKMMKDEINQEAKCQN